MKEQFKTFKERDSLTTPVQGQTKRIIPTVRLIEFMSIREFTEYIMKEETSFNFMGRVLSSTSVDEAHIKNSQTQSFDEAKELLENGWSEKAKEINEKLNILHKESKTTTRNFYDVSGYQVSVPRYLQGIPESMVNSKKVAVKHKIITLTKTISYSWDVKPETILEQSLKALKVVQDLEAKGFRVNLNVMYAAFNHESLSRLSDITCFTMVKVRIKNANERLNISKVAFPLVHPAMLRRLFFRFIEVNPTIERQFRRCYGYPIPDYFTKKLFDVLNRESTTKDYLLPAYLNENGFTLEI